MVKSVQEAVDTRYSARYFDKDKTIEKKDFDLIIRAGLKAPSGFGIEPWKIFVIKGNRQSIFKSCYEQQAILDSSEVVVVAYVKRGYIDKNPTFYDKVKRLPNYAGNKAEDLVNKLVATNYFREQTIFAASQMVLQATSIGIDNLIMSGFNEDALLKDLDLDQSEYGLMVAIAFGYNTKPATTHDDRRSYDDVVADITL